MKADSSGYDSLETTWFLGDFKNFGGGLMLHVGKFIGGDRIIDLSGSIDIALAKRAGVEGYDYTKSGEMNLSSQFINVGLYANLIPKLSFLAGYQMYTALDDSKKDGKNKFNIKDVNMLAGLEYKVNNGAYLLVEGGAITHTDKDDSSQDFEMKPILMTKIKVNF